MADTSAELNITKHVYGEMKDKGKKQIPVTVT